MENKLDAIDLQILLLRSICKKYKTKNEKNDIRKEIKYLSNKKYRLCNNDKNINKTKLKS